MFKDAGLDAILCDTYIDPHFISYIEYKEPKRVRFLRIDADVAGALKEMDSGEDASIVDLFTKALEGKNVKVKTEKLKNSAVPAVINVSEFMRRMNEMHRFYQMGDSPEDLTLVVNSACPAVTALKSAAEEVQTVGAKQIYYLALMNFRQLNAEEIDDFTTGYTGVLLQVLNPQGK